MNLLQPAKWVELYGDYLLKFALFRLNDVALCEDLVQETFLAGLKASENFKGESSEKTWLTNILKNKIIDEYRKKSRSKIVDDETQKEETDFTNFFEKNENDYGHWQTEQKPIAWEKSILDKMVTQEYYQVLKRCMSKLPELQFNLIQEKFFIENDPKNICKKYNITQSNYWVMIHRVHIVLRKCIEINWVK